MQQVIRQICRLSRTGHFAELTDVRLLELFVRERDEQAFEQLVERHARMLLGVCHRVTRDAHLAEDAFQACLLTLAQKASTIHRGQSVAGWLYKVAVRIAVRSRRRADRHRASEPFAVDVAAPSDDGAERRDLRALLDEEIGRLPEKHRAPIVLCCVEGKTNEEAAREIGCPKGTVLSRLSRARSTLRGRLTARGVTLSTAAMLSCLSTSSASAAPRSLVQSALQSIRSGIVSENVKCLMGGIVMSGAVKVKITLSLFIVAGLAAAGIAHVSVRAKAARDNVRRIIKENQENAVLKPGAGLIGRTTANGQASDAIFHYEHGKVFHPKLLFPKFGKPGRKVGLKITFSGELHVNAPTTVHVYHSGGSSSHGHSTLWVDGNKLSRIGDDTGKNAMHKLELKKGSYAVTWELTGGYFGCALLKFQDPQTKQLMPLQFTAADLKGLKNVPLKKVIEIKSDKRGWPIRNGW